MTALPFDGVTAILVAAGGDGGAARAFCPAIALSAAINVASAFATFVTAASFFCRQAGERALFPGRRSQHRLHRAQHLRRLHRQRVQRQLHRARAGDRAADADPSALLSRDVPGAAVRDESGAGGQQYRADVGRHRDGDADHGGDGRHLPHARGDRSGVEILHPRQRRHRAGAVRHDPRLHGGAPGGGRGDRRHGVDDADDARRRVRAGAAQPRLRLPDARLRHQGRPRAAARLAARRARRRPDADFRGSLRAAAQRRALRGAALQAAARRQRQSDRAGAADGDAGHRVADLRRLHALPAARHQTPVRVLFDRAHGHHRLRLRHGRAAGQFRRTAAHDDALA